MIEGEEHVSKTRTGEEGKLEGCSYSGRNAAAAHLWMGRVLRLQPLTLPVVSTQFPARELGNSSQLQKR